MPTNPFQCGTSSQYFTRIDHLGRPALTILVATCAPTPKRSHTVALSATSGSVVLRIDLLSRHSTLHDPNRDSASAKRRCTEGNRAPIRASQAYEGCAKNHLRCDDDKPCRRCQRKGTRCNLPTGSVVSSPPTPVTQLEANAPGNDRNSLLPLQRPQQPHQPRGMINLNFLESYNARAPFEYEAATASTLAPSVEAAENAVTQADHAAREERLCSAPDGGLFLCPKIMAMLNTSLRNLDMGPGPDNCLDLASQDKILSIVLSQMPLPFSLNAASFPSPELLDRLILYFLSVSFSSAGAWIYRSTFIPKQSRSEFVLAMAAAGAVLTPDSALRKLGFAMQEVVRHRLPAIFEADNTLIRDFGLHQHGGPDAHEPPQVENIVHCSETA
ncbi:uncharacterized protein N7525_001196 [Penicillium rubens]|uniref:uncharacterized protein n=1 Tax=Penicillium rubens TaxID=1108849 RepID=UPI002A5A5260|nr:uncharacterized protein N7525_001196 [Penicillium rubens]KAJ5843455.1 hypothetical protein N7525_001196 [Penicillium rubens]